MMEKLRRLAQGVNAYTLRFDPALLDPVRASFARDIAPHIEHPGNQHLFAGGAVFRLPVGPPPCEYFVFSYDDYPLLWFSNNSPATYAVYERFFQALGIADEMMKLVDADQRIVMYSGFLVIGDRAPEPLWHIDYLPGANAYTLITPLNGLDPDQGHLLYKAGEQEREYRYAPGEAIVLGEGFLHSTAPYGPSRRKRVLVSMTFGTDKLAHWPVLEQAVRAQSNYYILPCGHANGTCQCLLKEKSKAFWKRLGGN